MSKARQLAQKPSQPTGRKNLIINGGQVVSQRYGTSEKTGLSSGDTYITDRFVFKNTAKGTWKAQQVTDSPDGFENSLKVTCTTADTSTGTSDQLRFMTKVEGYNFAHLEYGTSNAKTFTVSFWFKSSDTGTYAVSFETAVSSLFYNTTFTVSAANTWEYKTITVAGSTGSSGYNTTNGVGLTFSIWLAVGTSLDDAGTPNSWVTDSSYASIASGQTVDLADTVNNYAQITGVQLEVGSTATEFEHRSFGEELALCQRYFWKTYEYETAVGSVTNDSALGRFIDDTQNYASIQIPYNPMRSQPTATIYNPNDGTTGEIRTDNADKSALITRLGSNGNGFIYVNNSSVGKSVGTHAHLTLEAEL